MEPNQTLALRPRVARNLFLLVWLTLLLLLLSFYLYAGHRAEVAFERNLIHSSTTEALVLDDHIDRSFAGVFSKLVLVQALSEVLPGNPASIDPGELTKLIDEDRSVRSLSLLDRQGKVLASSNPENIGLTVRESTFGFNIDQAAAVDVPAPLLSPAQPYRDIYDLVSQKPSSTQKLMLASLAFKKEGQAMIWVATVNLGLFENLWERLGHHEDTEIALLDYKGRVLLSHHSQEIDQEKLAAELLSRVENRQIGYFNFGKNNQFLVVYRATSQHPKIFVTISNRQVLSAPLIEEKKELLQITLALAGAFSILFWFIYSWYRRYEKAVTYSNNLLRGITAHVMMTRSDLEGSIIEANEPFLTVTGYTLEEVLGKNHRIFNSHMQSAEFYQGLWSTITRGEIWKGTFRNKTKSGHLIWVNATIIPYRDQWGKVLHYTALYSDITKAIEISERFERERKQRESLERINSALRTDLNLDPLTHLANRRGLDQFLEQLQCQPDVADAPISVLMLDLDHFKFVNDTWGHEVGDEVLKELARRWLEQIRSSDMLVRIGGEEFVAVLGRTNQKSAVIVAEKIRVATESMPVTLKRESGILTVPITVSVGIATAPKMTGTDFKQLYRVADEALYEAKRSGRNCVRSRST